MPNGQMPSDKTFGVEDDSSFNTFYSENRDGAIHLEKKPFMKMLIKNVCQKITEKYQEA